MNTYAILRRRGWSSPDDLQESAVRSRKVGDEEMTDRLRWIRTYALGEEGGSLGTVCIYQAESREAIREHASRVSMPCDEIIPIANTLIVRPDPEPAEPS